MNGQSEPEYNNTHLLKEPTNGDGKKFIQIDVNKCKEVRKEDFKWIKKQSK